MSPKQMQGTTTITTQSQDEHQQRRQHQQQQQPAKKSAVAVALAHIYICKSESHQKSRAAAPGTRNPAPVTRHPVPNLAVLSFSFKNTLTDTKIPLGFQSLLKLWWFNLDAFKNRIH